MSRWRSPYDREILGLAVPALGALAAGPLYSLVDTAIVGHLGAKQLAALALAATVLAAIVELADFLSYGTTGQVARLHAAGAGLEAGEIFAQALWLAAAAGAGTSKAGLTSTLTSRSGEYRRSSSRSLAKAACVEWAICELRCGFS